jgi:CheY-like chemotaxis protein
MDAQPLVLLIEPHAAQHRHADLLEKAGFRSVSVLAQNLDVGRVLEQRPAVIAAELDGAANVTLDLAKRLRQDRHTRFIPVVIYGHELRPQDIENAARAGALWLQIEPGDGARLVAAVRGLVAASRDNDTASLKDG